MANSSTSQKEYTIDGVQAAVILGKRGIPENGFKVHYTLLAWDESGVFETLTIEPTAVDEHIRNVLNQRKALDKLG